MAVYFLGAQGIPAIKIGCTHVDNPVKRLRCIQVWSPVPLHLLAIDHKGDYLTEGELLHRFAADRMHGEWFAASGALRDLVEAVAEAGTVLGGWYLPEGYPNPWPGTPRVISPNTLGRRFNLTRGELLDLVGPSVIASGDLGLGVGMMPRVVSGLRALGHEITFHDLLPVSVQAA